MPTPAPAKPGSAKPSSAKPKKKKPNTVLDALTARLFTAQEMLQRFQRQLGAPDKDTPEPIRAAHEMAGLGYQGLIDLGHALPALKQMGWKPASTTIAVGDLVQVKPKRLGRFVEGGAFTPLQVARLRVVSIHGKYAKLTTVPEGDAIGLYPLNYFKPAPPALAK